MFTSSVTNHGILTPSTVVKYVLMVSFLPVIGSGGTSWALRVPNAQQQYNNIKPINFIILLTAKLTQFFVAFYNNLQFKTLLQVNDIIDRVLLNI